MAILITGGTGYLGTELVRNLLQRDEDIVIFDIAPRLEVLEGLKGNIKVVYGDLKVWPEVINAVKENEVNGIFHLGGLLGRDSEENPWASFQVNVAGSYHVLEAARLFGVKRVVFASSTGTYGLGAKGAVTDETLQRPTGMYGAGKLYIELLGRFYRRKYGLDFRCIRYSTVMGPGLVAN
jgi:nucleoside-diphosphate-sugar epimerase